MNQPRIPIPQEYAAKLKAAQSDRAMQGERRVVTILFSDVKGSTAMAESMDPEDWAEIMDQAFDFLIAPIYRYEGTLARLMGDAILAFFGAPLAHEDDPERAIRAGLDILEGIKPFCERARLEHGLDFGVRVGINTGTVVVGDIGSDLAMEYTAMGDAVNLASRMEQTAAPGTLQISESTFKLVAPLFDLEPLKEIEIKGRKDPVAAYRVIGPKAQPGRLRGIEGLSSPLIGRTQELSQLKQRLEELRQGRGGIVCLVGEAGLGKSRLLDELRAEWAKQPGHWTQTGGISYDMARPYSLFQQLFLKMCRIAEHELPETARELIEKLCDDFRPEATEDAARAAELILTFHQDSEAPIPEGEALKRELFAKMLSAWRQPAVLPAVLVFDDLHWADSASVELLQHLFQLADEIPILFLCALRPYRQSAGWQIRLHGETAYPHRFTQIALEPLSQGESTHLINSLLAVSELPPDLSQLIQNKAEGNPFFVEELIRTLIERGAIHQDQSGLHWRAAGRVEAISLPDNLQALLVSRIDRLEKDVRRTVQLASVIGRAFYFRVLEVIAEAADRLREHLNALQRVELIYEHARLPELEYIFKHDLTRDAAYESILRKERPKFHRQVAEAIEALFPNRLEEESHRLAYHYREAKDDQRALKYFTLAGDLARRLSAHSEAISNYSQAIELADRMGADPAQLSQLYSHRGRTYELAGRYDEALANYDELQERGRQFNQPALELLSHNARATIHAIPSFKWDPGLAEQNAKAALALAEQLGDRRGEAKALWNLMLVENFSERDAQAAIRYGERSLAIARENDLAEEKAYALHDLARAYSQAGRVEQATQTLTEARGQWEQLGNSEMLADNLTSSAFNEYLRGNLAQAIAFAERGLELSRKNGNAWGQAYSLMGLGMAHVELGEIAQGVAAFQESVARAQEAGFSAAGTVSNASLALTYALLGDGDRALAILDQPEQVPSEQDPARIFPLAVRASVLTSRGDRELASQLMEELGGQPEVQSSNPEFLGFATLLEADLRLGNEQFNEVLALVNNRLARMESYGADCYIPQLELLQARALHGLGRTDEALTVLERAERGAEKFHLRWTRFLISLETDELAKQAGDAHLAAAARRTAQELIQFISDHIDEAPLRESFRNLPRVRSILAA